VKLITSIIERAVTDILEPVTSKKATDVARNKKEAVYSDPEMKKLYALIKKLHSSGTPTNTIASLLNMQESTHPDRGDEWKEGDVREILREIKEHMPTIQWDT